MAAVDELGRFASCGLKGRQTESFAARVQRRIARGQTVEQSARSEAAFESGLAGARGMNVTLLVSCAAGLSVLVVARLLLMWEEIRARRRSRRADDPAEGVV